MASLDSLKARKVLTTGKIVKRVDDTPVAMRLWYTGTGSITSVTMTTATDLVIITSDGGTDTYTFASGSGTMGALADNINNDGVFKAKLLDCLRADVTTASNFLSNTAITATTDEAGNSCYDLLIDTSVPDYMTVCLSPFSTKDSNKGHRVGIWELKYRVNLNIATATGVRLYRRAAAPNGAKQGAEVLLFQADSVDDSATSITWSGGEAKLSSKDDDELIFRVGYSGAITDATTNYVEISGEIE